MLVPASTPLTFFEPNSMGGPYCFFLFICIKESYVQELDYKSKEKRGGREIVSETYPRFQLHDFCPPTVNI